MKSILSVLLFVTIATSSLSAQSSLDSVSRTSLVVAVRHSSDVALASHVTPPTVDAGRSHAMRNGAVIGAAVGVAAGIFAGSHVNFGDCAVLTNPGNKSSCSGTHSERIAAISFAVAGGLGGALVGAITGKLVSLAR
jgi:hypothetical protein